MARRLVEWDAASQDAQRKEKNRVIDIPEIIKEERIAETVLLLEEGKVNDCKANLHAHVRQSMSSRCDRKK